MTTIDRAAFYNCDSLKDVYYEGTEEQWEQVTVYADNEPLLNAELHFGS